MWNTEYSNPHTSSQQFVTLKVYDVLGREVATLIEEYKGAGVYHSEFMVSPPRRVEPFQTLHYQLEFPLKADTLWVCIFTSEVQEHLLK
jgi:hypothetical protein